MIVYSILCIRKHFVIFEVSYSSYHKIEQMFAVRNVLFLNLRWISNNCVAILTPPKNTILVICKE